MFQIHLTGCVVALCRSQLVQAVSLPRGRSSSDAGRVVASWPQPVWCMLCRCLLAAAGLFRLCRCRVAAASLDYAVSLPFGRSRFLKTVLLPRGRSMSWALLVVPYSESDNSFQVKGQYVVNPRTGMSLDSEAAFAGGLSCWEWRHASAFCGHWNVDCWGLCPFL